MSLRIAADQYLQNIDEFLPGGVDLFRFDPSGGLPKNITNYDALLIRTVTPINPQTLPETGNLKFIGTATAGTDHVDQTYLEEKGIQFSQSEGCNANAVAEYIITVLYHWAKKQNIDLKKKTVGIVGCGHTGSAVIRLLKRLDVNYIAYDPPKEIRENDFVSASESELVHADILTFHTPLSESGAYPTKHLGGNDWLSRGFDLIVNASRGGVVDENALLKLHQKGKIGNYILDVWEGEPNFSDRVAKHAFIATPHIAGYSTEAKFKASETVVKRLLSFFSLEPKGEPKPAPFNPNDFKFHPETSFADLLWQNNQIHYYDSELRKLIGFPSKKKTEAFAKLRSETKLRHEFKAMTNMLDSAKVPKEFRVFH
ncbi:4-phosphoerythronate dehydrogenase [Rhodohalobacter sp.]|uniref:4-phosphoerythronate dehydrogenase n=1 Tax=Rhodohalobacter sp. TaxID=1974210 RepID=UPI0035668690